VYFIVIFKYPKLYNLEDVIKSSINFYLKNKEKFKEEIIRENRKELSIHIQNFHKECGTLNNKIKNRIMNLQQDVPLILMTAHQPNLFPYSGVLRKATLIYVIGQKIEEQTGIKVVNFFGIADQDFTDDRWVKSSQLPAISRKDGCLTLSIKLPEKLMLKNITKPSSKKINEWKDQINIWLNNDINLIKNYCIEYGIPNWELKSNMLYNNFINFWKIVEEAHRISQSYSDFNAFIISKIVNEIWGYDTLFSRFSDCQRIFFNEFNFLLSRFSDYSISIKKELNLLPNEIRKKGVSEKVSEFLPFWYHCDCGSKARLFLKKREDNIIGFGNCINCNREFNINLGHVDKIDVSPISKNISARAIPMILIFSKGLGLSCYVGGIGGIEYLDEARYIANKLDIVLPPIVTWRPQDKYLGISQLETLIEYKKITGHYKIDEWEKELKNLKYKIKKIYKKIEKIEKDKDKIINEFKENEIDIKTFKNKLKIIIDKTEIIKNNSELSTLNYNVKLIEKIPNNLDIKPSIIDYAINIGLKETSKQWINFLLKNGSFASDVHMTSLFKEFEEIFLKNNFIYVKK